MTSILVVCTGNICRSPMAEGFLRDSLVLRFGDDAPTVSSAGTAGWEGSGAMPESVQAAAERGCDIAGHSARRLAIEMLRDADLVVCMAAEHRDEVRESLPGIAGRTFTLKELVRALEALDTRAAEAPASLSARVSEADALRQGGFEGNRWDEDVADPLGLPLESYRAIAWELDEWIGRLIQGLHGPIPAEVAEVADVAEEA